MKTTQVNLRLEPELIRDLQAAAKVESLERGTMMRKLLIEGLSSWKLEHALRRYQAGDISIGRACEETGRSHWEWIDLAQARGIAYRIDVEDSIARAREVIGRIKQRGVAESSPAYRAEPDDSLPDFAPRPGGVLVVGINPPPRSVNRGHYYQGRLGARLWKRLQRAGLLTNAVPGLEDEALVAAGHGLTDLVKRVTASADELTREELAAGVFVLIEKIHMWKPGLVLFVFKQAAVYALGRRDVQPGPCGEIGGVPAFLLSGPFAEGGLGRGNDDALGALLARTGPLTPQAGSSAGPRPL